MVYDVNMRGVGYYAGLKESYLLKGIGLVDTIAIQVLHCYVAAVLSLTPCLHSSVFCRYWHHHSHRQR